RFGLRSRQAGANRPRCSASAPTSNDPSGAPNTADGSSGELSNISGLTRPSGQRSSATVLDVPKSMPRAKPAGDMAQQCTRSLPVPGCPAMIGPMYGRWGLTVPLTGVPLAAHAGLLAEAGYTDVWSSEVAGCDAFTPLALASTWSPGLRLGTAIAPVYTRGPGLLAMTA